MSKSLVIVESPAKAKTINKYLGPDYVVKSSVGHIRDLPTSGNAKPIDAKARAAAAAITRKLSPEDKVVYKKKKAREQLVKRMGVDPDSDWKARYEVLPGKEKVVAELQKLAKSAEHIFLATDLDREGEAIAWHLKEAIGGDETRYKRVVFNEITKRAVEEAFSAPGELDMRYVEAQQARRFLDRVVGFMVSPLLWAKVARGLSAGRVQSVAVRLVVEREREIRAFVPDEFWEVFANLNKGGRENGFRCQVAKFEGKNFRPSNKAHTDSALEILKNSQFEVLKKVDKATSSKPRPPLITSTLQQAASTRLGFGVKKTMMMAQRLYEAGYITYMRTDSTHLSNDSILQCRSYIEKKFGKEYLPSSATHYSSKDGAQEAHEAIRPSDVRMSANLLNNMDPDAVKLYTLIWQFFVACQMQPAEYLSSSMTIGAGAFELRIKGRIMKFPGYLSVMPSKDEDVILPEVDEGDVLELINLESFQNFTKPPARFTEASLVKELEKRAIGRPSTYASIIQTIQDRGYAEVESKRFYSKKMGEIVADRLQESFEDLMDYEFTAKMEELLDEVASGEKNWKELLNEFYSNFTAELRKAESVDGGMRANDPTGTNIPCSVCGRLMQLRTASTGVFLGCSGYSNPKKEQCKHTMNLTAGDDAIRTDSEEEAEEKENRLLREKKRCPMCGTAMSSYLIDEQRKLHVCGNNPDCAGYEVEQGEFKIRGYDGPVIECDKCGKDMQLKTGRFGKYFGCSSEDCSNTRKLLRNGEAAPPKMDPVQMPDLKCETVDDHYVLRDGASGLFLAASQFPKNREIRAPLLLELLPYKKEIDEKYSFLFSGPVEDVNGLSTVVRFSRKTAEIYLQSEVEKKATGWKAFYQNGNWVVDNLIKKKTVKKKPTKRKASTKK
ncbi:type I DNA topoisomerase [Gammaproteobacteria bacterium]|nr:type I DNA topoisomerase [Gammaproteobacteria bacterium]